LAAAEFGDLCPITGGTEKVRVAGQRGVCSGVGDGEVG
jgi:hypothetical protein